MAARDSAFGKSVDVSGNMLVVGAPGRASSQSSGAVHIYRRGADGWSHTQTLRPDDPLPKSRFGRSVAVDGDTVVVGSTAI